MSKIEGLITGCSVEHIDYGPVLREGVTTLTIVINDYVNFDPSKPVTLTQEEEGA